MLWIFPPLNFLNLFLTWIVSRISSCDFFSCQVVVSRDVFCLKCAGFIWLEPRADPDKVTTQALDLGWTIKRVPFHGPDCSPNPRRVRMITFTRRELSSSPPLLDAPGKCTSCWVWVAAVQERWCDFIYTEPAGSASGKNQVLLLDGFKNAPKLLINLFKEDH